MSRTENSVSHFLFLVSILCPVCISLAVMFSSTRFHTALSYQSENVPSSRNSFMNNMEKQHKKEHLSLWRVQKTFRLMLLFGLSSLIFFWLSAWHTMKKNTEIALAKSPQLSSRRNVIEWLCEHSFLCPGKLSTEFKHLLPHAYGMAEIILLLVPVTGSKG